MKRMFMICLLASLLLSTGLFAEEYSSVAYEKKFTEAAIYCMNNREQGYAWRLPTTSELSRLNGSGKYWASDPSDDNFQAYLYNFNAGRREMDYHDALHNVVCIRSVTNTEQNVKAMEEAKSARVAQLKAQGFVDLGLPSGTMWAEKEVNENRYSFYEARRFGDNLPSVEQFEELLRYCTWEWRVYGYRVTSRQNGNSIFFSNNGFRNCEGNKHKTDSQGHYWTSTTKNGSKAWFFRTGSSTRKVTDDNTCSQKSVHLVVKP